MLLQLRHVVRQLTLRVVASSALRQLPILRGLLLKLNTVSCGRRTLAHYVPLRLNVEFHKLLALVVGGLAFFHVFAHFMNFAEAPVVTLNLFPSTVNPPWFGVVRYAPWVTGGLITWSMFYIYSAAPQLVRRAKYEVFWWNHHFFVLFYVAQIFHGPRFLYWTVLPILLYILERILRVRRGRRKVYVKSVKWIDPYVAHCTRRGMRTHLCLPWLDAVCRASVMCLELMPANRAEFKFVEGQYIYLNCPYISPNEWHPFTISSAAGDLDFDDHVLTVHIRVYPKGWTGKLKDYFGLMNPQNRCVSDSCTLDAQVDCRTDACVPQLSVESLPPRRSEPAPRQGPGCGWPGPHPCRRSPRRAYAALLRV